MNRIREVVVATVMAIGQVLFLFGLLGWGYGVLIELTHPEWLSRLSHLTGTLRLDTFAIACFILSAVGFFIWRLTEQLSKQDQARN
jgi:hypothetical protein